MFAALCLPVNNRVCQNCQESIDWAQLAKHTIWTPITCKGCGTKYVFDSVEFYKWGLPQFSLGLLLYVHIKFGHSFLAQELYIVVLVVVFITFLVSVIYGFFRFRRIKLVEYKKT